MSAGFRVPVPRSSSDVRLVARTARLVLTLPVYAAVAVAVAVATLGLFVLSQNFALVRDVVVAGTLPLEARLVVLAELLPFVGTSYGPVAGTGLLLVAVLAGVNIAMVTYHFREHRVTAAGGGSLAGVLLGALGAGCAACGSAILVGLLSIVGAGGLVLLLPFDGLEFTALAVVALLLSTYWLADGMRGGEINGCPIDA